MRQAELAEAINQFGADMFSRLWTDSNKQDNVFISSPSIMLALSMTLNGTGGQTRNQMARALGIPEGQLAAANASVKALVAELQKGDPKVTLMIANALFGRLGYPFNPNFLEVNRRYFDAQVENLDFQNNPDGSRDRINQWCSEKTQGMINQVVDKVPPDALIYLANAIFFFAPWAVEFDEKLTQPRPFTLADGSVKQQSTMLQSGKYSYRQTPEYQAVVLPYASGRFSMLLYLPTPGSNIGNLVNQLSRGELKRSLQQFGLRPGTVLVPRFKLSYSQELSKNLKSQGMTLLFDRDNADFSNMVPPGESAAITRVIHKTALEVTEKGTKAAAVTVVEGVRTTSVLIRDFFFDANRPFFCAIHDTETGTLLFQGAVCNPEQI